MATWHKIIGIESCADPQCKADKCPNHGKKNKRPNKNLCKKHNPDLLLKNQELVLAAGSVH